MNKLDWKNPEAVKKYHRQYHKIFYKKHGDKLRTKSREYRKNNLEIVKKKNRDYARIKYQLNLLSWEGFIPKKTNCQICNREIFFNQKNIRNAIHFDHRNGGDECIKNQPITWLSKHKRTPEREKIWKSCDFGKLCNHCNLSLPTKNRREFFIKAIKYVLGEDYAQYL
jgi:hypothetical protein